MGKYFATDGIRKRAEYFTTEFLQKVALGLYRYGVQKKGLENPRILIGGDTRESSEWMLADLERAFESLGVECRNVGVLPTPGINYVFYEMGFDFAIDVTASHNGWEDNGIKIMERGKKSGVKLSELGAEVIETVLDNAEMYDLKAVELKESLHADAVNLYKKHLENYALETGKQCGSRPLTGLKIGLDCANGATSVIGAESWEKLGAKVEVINQNKSYGRLINLDCGSTHMEKLIKLVQNQNLDFGVAYDGDGDRCLMVTRTGKVVKGDEIIAIIAEYLDLKQVVVTVMSNQGIFDWAKRKAVKLQVVSVGDTNVSIAMREQEIQLGGEECGHIILPGQATGDGMLTSLLMAKIIAESQKDLGDLAGTVQIFPQVIHNMKATAEDKALLKAPEIQEILDDYQKKLEGENGRLLVRPSGTEDLVRITVWGEHAEKIQQIALEIEQKIKLKLEEIK